jgi:hypothetical protein
VLVRRTGAIGISAVITPHRVGIAWPIARSFNT